MMVRTIAGQSPRARNEDFAIVTIEPLPSNALHFLVVDKVIREFCANRRVPIMEVQSTHLGQAFIHFKHEYGRYRFVIRSPHSYGGVLFTFVRHN